ncbi:hypothetical protein SED60170_11280 [Salmonella enterica subsp. diarizonae serovar 60:r:e,n,x,z15 str. 01-0170]|nr:hypothetical protein SED60170_11280 [Salmonella enterica subsp. diarizonae serovar 60:r:e,n,x,z15 str. 01-0170]
MTAFFTGWADRMLLRQLLKIAAVFNLLVSLLLQGYAVLLPFLPLLCSHVAKIGRHFITPSAVRHILFAITGQMSRLI